MNETKKKLGPGDDLEMLQTPDLWPNWPALPMRRYKPDQTVGFPEVGVVLDMEGLQNMVVKINLFYLNALNGAERIRDAEKYRYESLEALLADGWIVD